MAIEFQCNKCRAKMQIQVDQLGDKTKCPKCETFLAISKSVISAQLLPNALVQSTSEALRSQTSLNLEYKGSISDAKSFMYALEEQSFCDSVEMIHEDNKDTLGGSLESFLISLAAGAFWDFCKFAYSSMRRLNSQDDRIKITVPEESATMYIDKESITIYVDKDIVENKYLVLKIK